MVVFVSSCGCLPRSESYVGRWIGALHTAGHEVIDQMKFEGYQNTFAAIASADAVAGLVNRANGTQWAIELAAAVEGTSIVNNAISYRGERKPTYLFWADELEAPFAIFDEFVAHGAVRLPADLPAAIDTLLEQLGR
jgi:hypothetical protein